MMRAWQTPLLLVVLMLFSPIHLGICRYTPESGTYLGTTQPPLKASAFEVRRGLQTEQWMNDCAYNKLTSVFTSCQANAVAGHAINIRAEVLSLLQSCFIAFGQEAKKVPELMMQTGNAIPTAIRDAATRFGNMTTHPVQLREVPSLKWIAALLETLANPANASAPDAWQTSTSTLASAVMANAVLDLTNLVSSDRQLDWADLFAPARQYGVLFGKRVVGIPWSTVPLLLYTRDDILQANNLTAPATWRELVDVATRLHGAGNMSGICISWCPSARWPGYLYKAMMAAYVQVRISEG
mmetsp:Transcript_2251/g.5044  ORF Transcript_2251/g.5044 Transcript_2251/m.5044 type:complete len:297 (+) Transcript_2251:159-1049(+)